MSSSDRHNKPSSGRSGSDGAHRRTRLQLSHSPGELLCYAQLPGNHTQKAFRLFYGPPPLVCNARTKCVPNGEEVVITDVLNKEVVPPRHHSAVLQVLRSRTPRHICWDDHFVRGHRVHGNDEGQHCQLQTYTFRHFEYCLLAKCITRYSTIVRV